MSEMLNGIRGPYITGWSLQSSDVWRQLQQKGTYRAGQQYYQGSDFNPTFTNAYEWMRRQMQQRSLSPQGQYPVWFYCRVSRETLREHAQYSEQSVLLVCRFAVTRILLSDYHAWHHVLNDWYLNDTADNIEAWFAAMEQRLGTPLGNHENSLAWPIEIRREIERSWERIFDIQHWLRSYPDSIVQGVVAELYRQDVIQAIPLDLPGVNRTRRIAGVVQHLKDNAV